MIKKLISISLMVILPSLTYAEAEFFDAIATVKTYTAQFTQIIRDDVGKVVAQSKGKMSVKRPNRFLWQTHSPDPIKVIGDGNVLWSYDIDLEQVTKQDLQQAMRNSPAAILAGDVDSFKQNFTVKTAKNSLCKEGKTCYELIANDRDSVFTNMMMMMDGNKLTELHLADQMGQRVTTVFTNVKVNASIPDKLFNFSPPKGIDIVDMEQNR